MISDKIIITKTLAEVERDYILQAMRSLGNNKAEVARALGISIKTLYNKLHEYQKFDEYRKVGRENDYGKSAAFISG